MVSALLIYKNAGGCLRCSKRQGNITYNGHYLMEKKNGSAPLSHKINLSRRISILSLGTNSLMWITMQDHTDGMKTAGMQLERKMFYVYFL